MKDILKKQYEKAVLAVLALGFIFSLLYLLQMLESAKSVTERDLKYTTTRNNYEVQNFFKEDYDINHKLGIKSVWNERQDNDNMGFTAELVVPMKSLRCSHKDCKKIMPWVIAQGKGVGDHAGKRICPHCERELPDPGEPKDYASEIARRDTDGDGMPDRYERRMGFKLDDEKDAEEDKDGDGFSNYYEFLVGTDPNDISSYPSLAKCLYLAAMNRVVMPVKLTQVTRIPDPDNKDSKKNWEITLLINRMEERKSIGDTFTIKSGTYKILDAIYIIGDKSTGNVQLDDDKSRVIIAPVVNGKVNENAKIELVTGKPAYEPEPRVTIRDVRFKVKEKGRNHIVRKGDTFKVRVKGEKVKGEKDESISFFVKETDVAKGTVTIVDVESNEATLLVKQAKPPKNAYVRKTDGVEENTTIRRSKRKRRR